MWLLLLACANTPAPTAPTGASGTAVEVIPPRDVPVGAFEAAIRGGAVPIVVDVRTAEEFAQGHVPGARNIPVDQLEARLAELEPYKAGGVYVICQTGGRSARAASELSGHGFRAYNVLGGTAGWKTGGFPIETSSP